MVRARGILGDRGFLFLPGSEKLVCVVQEDGRRSIAVHDGELGFRTIISAPKDGNVGGPGYSASTGHLLYNLWDSVSGDPSIWAVPIDAADGVASGPGQLVEDMALDPSIADDGYLYFVRATAGFGPAQLVRVDREGKIGESIGQAQPALTSPALSPDGRQVAVSGRGDDGPRISGSMMSTGTSRSACLMGPAVLGDPHGRRMVNGWPFNPATARSGVKLTSTSRILTGACPSCVAGRQRTG